VAAAEEEFEVSAVSQGGNGDESRYSDRIGSYSKGLPHNSLGEVEPGAYRRFLEAVERQSTEAFENVPLGGDQALVNPMAGVAFDLEGVDIQKLACPASPELASATRAAEMVELYWMALLRDVNFSAYETDARVTAAAQELSGLTAFSGPRDGSGRVTGINLFRGFASSDRIGPYISQLFLTPFAYGQYLMDGRITTFAAGADYLIEPGAWLACQNGQGPFGKPKLDGEPRYFRNGRDLAAYVHSDQVCQAFYNAGLRLYALGAPANPGNPYLRLSRQTGFATFGPPHFLTLQAEAALRAMKAVFFQKWFVHRALRPEAYGGLVHMSRTGQASYPLDPSVLNSQALAETAARHGSFLLPQAFPEGCPQHPSYTQAHGGVAGACATILKAAFDGTANWESLAGGLMESSSDGLSLVRHSGENDSLATVNSEIEKLCGNIALARNFAGVHWRSDYVQGLLLGEAMALTILADQREIYGEQFRGFEISRFDGRVVTV